ncbi:MAG: hypothetical protein ACR2G0_03705 [Chthoniobacterales bacterium]
MKQLKYGVVLLLALSSLSLPFARADQPDQPRMRDALARLKEARIALVNAEHNKSGHRVKAVKLVDEAIAEIEAGIAEVNR